MHAVAFLPAHTHTFHKTNKLKCNLKKKKPQTRQRGNNENKVYMCMKNAIMKNIALYVNLKINKLMQVIC